MKPRTPLKFCDRVVPPIALILLSASLLGCGKDDMPKKVEAKTGAATDLHKKEQESKHPGIVYLSPEQRKAAGIEVKEVVAGVSGASLTATAVVEPNNDRVSRIGARVAGRIAKVTAVQGDRVKPGQPLAYLESMEFEQAWSEYAKAKGRQTLAAGNLKREEALFEIKAVPEKDVLRARQEFSEAAADLALYAKKLRMLGLEESKQESPSDALKNNRHLIVISSPLPGVVTEKTVTQGEMVSPDKVLFTVCDLSSLWVAIDVYEKDLSRIGSGMEVNLSVAAYPDTLFKGRISYIADIMDEKTRTVKARVTIDNREGYLKPGMFATVVVDSIKDPSTGNTIEIPEEAVFLDGSERCVFLHEGEGRFVVRRVSVGRASGRFIEIKEGLKAGDAVVARGVFALKSELKKETLHADEH